jgi:phosphotransacetylase
MQSPEECALHAAKMVRESRLDCVMKGRIETGALMKVMVNREYGIRRSETMSAVAFVESSYYHKMFAITDVGLLTYPTLEQKRDAIVNAVGAFHKLGVSKPKVAVLAAIERVNPKMKETVEADALKQMNRDGEIRDCVVEGPISYDLSMEAEAAEIKEYKSPVAGDADILVVPDLVSGNILTKSLAFTGGAKQAGSVIGAMAPLILTSRATSMEDKYRSILLNAYIGKI